jgi:hypothetical protein
VARYGPEAVGLPAGSRAWCILGVDEVASPPVALHEPPRARHEHRVPRVAEPVVLETHARLVPRRLAVPLYHHAVEPCVAATEEITFNFVPLASSKGSRNIFDVPKRRRRLTKMTRLQSMVYNDRL